MSTVGDVYQLRIVGKFDGEPVMNSLAFQVLNPAETFGATAALLVSDLDLAWGILAPTGIFAPGLSVQYAISNIEVHDVIPGLSPVYSQSSSAVGGVDDDDAMPPNDALCVTLRTEARGQGARGRIYLTGFAEGSANGGYWEAGAQAYASALMYALDNAFGAVAGGNFLWGVLHRSSNGGVKHAPVLPLVPPQFLQGSGWTIHNEVRSLGRRAVGRRIRRKRTAP